MDNLYEIAKNNLSADNEHFDAFEYIKTINTLLDNPVQKTQGRDLTIRALNEKSKFSHHIKQLRAMIRKAGLYPYLYSEFDDLDSDEKLATEIYRSPNSDDFIFHSTINVSLNSEFSGSEDQYIIFTSLFVKFLIILVISSNSLCHFTSYHSSIKFKNAFSKNSLK